MLRRTKEGEVKPQDFMINVSLDLGLDRVSELQV
jgi:hypothetical protein